jgi:hypothetical protein
MRRGGRARNGQETKVQTLQELNALRVEAKLLETRLATVTAQVQVA